jgi:electron transfer flavoprotein beta subunit
MKILVCVKHVPDTETRVKIGADGRSLDETGVKMIISPYDEFALEEALRLREAAGEGEVVLACVGREAAQASLRQGLAMGADRAVILQDEIWERADALSRATALAAIAKAESPALIFTGKTGVGGDEGLTGPMLAELLDLPHASAVFRLELGAGAFKARRSVEGAVEVVEGPLPALIAWEKGEHEPRYPSLKGIMAAKKKPLEIRKPADLGLPPAPESRVAWESLELPPPRQAAKVLQGDSADAARELVRLLRDEAKVI